MNMDYASVRVCLDKSKPNAIFNFINRKTESNQPKKKKYNSKIPFINKLLMISLDQIRLKAD